MNNILLSCTPLISLHKFRTVYEHLKYICRRARPLAWSARQRRLFSGRRRRDLWSRWPCCLSPWGLYRGPGMSYFWLEGCPPGVPTGTSTKDTSSAALLCFIVFCLLEGTKRATSVNVQLLHSEWQWMKKCARIIFQDHMKPSWRRLRGGAAGCKRGRGRSRGN